MQQQDTQVSQKLPAGAIVKVAEWGLRARIDRARGTAR